LYVRGSVTRPVKVMMKYGKNWPWTKRIREWLDKKMLDKKSSAPVHRMCTL
jgi:hypothetical protein